MKDKIYITSFISLFILVVLALIFATADINYDALFFSLDKTATIMGIFVSTIGIFITVYFVILAINAYSSIKEIEKVKEIIQQDKEIIRQDTEHIERKKTDFDNLLKIYAKSLYNGFEAQIAITNTSDNQSLCNELRLGQARLSYQFPMLDEKIRENLLWKLAYLGKDKEDVVAVKSIAFYEQGDIQVLSKLVLEELKNRLQIA